MKMFWTVFLLMMHLPASTAERTSTSQAAPRVLSVEISPAVRMHEEGSSVSLLCLVTGIISKRYSAVWSRVSPEPVFIVSSEDILVGDDRYSVSFKKVLPGVVLKLVVKSVREFDTGMYGCHIYEQKQGLFHPIKRSTLALTVQARGPLPICVPRDQETLFVGSEISCKTTGRTVPVIAEGEGDLAYETTHGSNGAILTKRVTPSDDGKTFVCVAVTADTHRVTSSCNIGPLHVMTLGDQETTTGVSTSSAMETTTLEASNSYQGDNHTGTRTDPSPTETTPETPVIFPSEGPPLTVLIAVVIGELVLLLIIHLIVTFLCFRFDPSRCFQVIDVCASAIPLHRKEVKSRRNDAAGKRTPRKRRIHYTKPSQPTYVNAPVELYDLSSTSAFPHSSYSVCSTSLIQTTRFMNDVAKGDSDTSSCDSSAYETVINSDTRSRNKLPSVHQGLKLDNRVSPDMVNSEDTYMDLNVVEQQPSLYTELKHK